MANLANKNASVVFDQACVKLSGNKRNFTDEAWCMASFYLNYTILYFALSGNTLWTCIHFSNVQSTLEAYINLIWLPPYEQRHRESVFLFAQICESLSSFSKCLHELSTLASFKSRFRWTVNATRAHLVHSARARYQKTFWSIPNWLLVPIGVYFYLILIRTSSQLLSYSRRD